MFVMSLQAWLFSIHLMIKIYSTLSAVSTKKNVIPGHSYLPREAVGAIDD